MRMLQVKLKVKFIRNSGTTCTLISREKRHIIACCFRLSCMTNGFDNLYTCWNKLFSE